jgi:hypothetical protein
MLLERGKVETDLNPDLACLEISRNESIRNSNANLCRPSIDEII